MLAPDPNADLERSLAHWRRYRRRKRLADIHWIDALYQAYLTALLGGAAILGLVNVVGDDPLTPGQLARVVHEGDDWLGVVVAVALAIGLRSGSRGGPVALERAEVRHVLLAPVDRTTALRGPVLRQLRFYLFVAAVVGAVAGVLASLRLDHPAVLWVGAGALLAMTVVVLAYGAALCAAALRLSSPAATLAGVTAIGWAVADGLDVVDGSPLSLWGRIGLWPESFSPWGFVAVAASLAVLGGGILLVGDLSIEAAERRSTLVGQLRFAATLQDLRTVIVLRRQLAMEHARLRPWLRLRVRDAGRFPVWARGWRGVLRWPLSRVGRMVLLAVGAGVALRGVWSGTTPLLAVAAVALYIAGLEAMEPLAQEIDHPTRLGSVPVARGAVHLRHLLVGVAVMTLTGVVGAAAAVLVAPSRGGLAVAAVSVVPVALGAVAGAATSLLSGPPDASGADGWSLVPPEVAGMRLVVRTAWPLVLVAAGTLPVLAARSAADAGDSAAAAAAGAGVGVAVVFGLVASWIRKRDDLHAAWQAALDQAFPDKSKRAEEGTAGAS